MTDTEKLIVARLINAIRVDQGCKAPQPVTLEEIEPGTNRVTRLEAQRAASGEKLEEAIAAAMSLTK